MGFFDTIGNFFDSNTTAQFDKLYNNYYKALELFVRGGYKHPFNKMFESKEHMFLSRDMSYKEKKYLVSRMDDIISKYKLELEYEEVSNLMSKHPCGFTIVCHEEFNIDIKDAPEIAKKALWEYQENKNSLEYIFTHFDRKSTYNGTLYGKLKHQILTMEEVYLWSTQILKKKSLIESEDAKWQKKANEWQKENDDRIIAHAKSIANLYPCGYNKLVGFRIQTMSLGQAKTTLEYESRIKQYEKEIKDKENFPFRIKKAVESWTRIKDIPYFFFYYYYPKRISNVTFTSEKARKMIWNFKDGVQQNDIIKLMKEKLLSTFNTKDLKELTFVCIPASTKNTNIIRYKNFSNEICRSTGMRNAFDHIRIIKEKDPSYLGGTSSSAYYIDDIFFKGAYVILFDDVITKGTSMENFEKYLTNLGANVVCSISIGRTYGLEKDMIHPYTGSY